ncbi:DUF6884 domain-containing protein [Haloferax sp. Q22]|uniref:DUF6884 domain-containing protein n=1 Tax=Haloferax sp. (strain Q22) TaxID=1526048 RepID=UPI000737B40D|nr:DUF6884 domain-containing protein [Haloferax sp. Q22]
MARPELEQEWRSNAAEKWEQHIGEKVPESLDQAYSLTSEHPDVFDFNQYFFELLDNEHEKREDFIAREIDQQKYDEKVRVVDRDPIRKTGDVEELICDYCDSLQFSLSGVEDLTVCRPCIEDAGLEDQGSFSDFFDQENRYVLVGCGSKKTDESGMHPAGELYTSSYFEKKANFAEEFGDEMYVVSAKFGVVHSETSIWNYDATIEDVYTDEWLDVVEKNLDEKLDWTESDEVYVLVGKKYLDAEDHHGRSLRAMLNESPPEIRYPFSQTSGIGKQQQYLDEVIEEDDPVMPYELWDTGQSTLSSF